MPQAERRRTPTEREHELAMAVATKQRPERSTRVTITNDNSKHAIHATVEVTDPDADAAWRTAALLMERSLEQFGDPARAEAVGEYQAEVRRLKDAKKETTLAQRFSP